MNPTTFAAARGLPALPKNRAAKILDGNSQTRFHNCIGHRCNETCLIQMNIVMKAKPITLRLVTIGTICALCFLSRPCSAQANPRAWTPGPTFDQIVSGQNDHETSAQQAAEQARAAAIEKWQNSFVPRDPWRNFNGETNYIRENGVEFCGKVMDVTKDGVRIEGDIGELFQTDYSPGSLYNYKDFFVENFPFEVVDDQIIYSSEHLMAWSVGTYTYTTVTGASRTIRKLEYGTPCDTPDWYLKQQAAAIAAAQEAAQIRIMEAQRQSFNTVEKLATNGDASMQYSLGIRYLKGEGCDTNRDQAIYWITKSANQGDLEASNKLVSLQK